MQQHDMLDGLTSSLTLFPLNYIFNSVAFTFRCSCSWVSTSSLHLDVLSGDASLLKVCRYDRSADYHRKYRNGRLATYTGAARIARLGRFRSC